jgi:hypothetical protein
MTNTSSDESSTAILEKPAIDPKLINVQVIYRPGNRPGGFGDHLGPMRYPVLVDEPGDNEASRLSAKTLLSPVFAPLSPVPITLEWHQLLMEKSEPYRKDIEAGVLTVFNVRSNLDRPTDSSMDFEEMEAIQIANGTLDMSWLDKSTADPRSAVMQAVQIAKARIRADEDKIAAALNQPRI